MGESKARLQLLFKDNNIILNKDRLTRTNARKRSKDTESLSRNLISIIETVYITLRENRWGLTKQATVIFRSYPQQNDRGWCSDEAIGGEARGRTLARGKGRRGTYFCSYWRRKENGNCRKEYKRESSCKQVFPKAKIAKNGIWERRSAFIRRFQWQALNAAQ